MTKITPVDPALFARCKLAEYAIRHGLMWPLEDFPIRPIGERIAFLAHIMCSVRADIAFGEPRESPSLWELYREGGRANCGVYCGAFQAVTDSLALESRQVRLAKQTGERHVGIEFLVDDSWVYFDPMFGFFACTDHPFSAQEIRDTPGLLGFWDEHFSPLFQRYGERLSDYFFSMEIL